MKKILSLLLVALMIVGMLPMTAINANAAEPVTFQLGANGSASHNDGSEKSTYSETVDGYTLSITGGTKMYTGARDAKGNSCIKLGTSKAVGGFTFTVPSEVSEVVICVAKYKSSASKVNINGTDYTLTKNSNDGAYDEITVDTSSNKTVKVTTVASSYRAMVNSITFAFGGDTVECEHANVVDVDAVAATCTTSGYTAGKQCANPDCGAYTEGHEEIAATGHAYGDWVDTTAATCTEAGEQSATCANCGDVKTQAVKALGHDYDENGTCANCGNVAVMTQYELVTDAASLKDGDQIIIVGANADGAYSVMIPYASGANNLKAESVSAPVDGKIFLADTSAAAIITLGGDSTGWTFFDGTYYLYSAGTTKSNYLKGKTALPDDNTGAWTIAIDESGVATIINVGNNAEGARNVIKFNYGNSPVLFANYASTYVTKVNLVSLYRVSTGEPEVPACTHSNTTTETVAATCTEAGSETVTCADCGEVVSTTEIPMIDHNFVDGYCSVCKISKEDWESEIDTPNQPTSATITFDDKAKRTTFTTSQQVWEENNITVTNNKSSSTSNVGDYANPARFYKNSQLIISYTSKITKIEMTGPSGEYFDAIKSSLTAANVEYTVVDNVVTIEFAEPVESFEFKMSGGQGRLASITVYAEAGGHSHSWSEWTGTEATCTTAGEKSRTCSGCGETETQTIPAAGHTYVYADGVLSCSVCSATFEPAPIVNTRTYTAGEVYYFEGVVTYVDSKQAFIQDETAGICVYFDGGAPADIAIGDKIRVWDALTTFNGLIETTYTKTTEYAEVSADNTVDAQELTIETLKNETTNEYLSELVSLSGVTVSAAVYNSDKGNVTYTLTDADGNTIEIYGVVVASEDECVAVDSVVDVEAIASTYNGKYQLVTTNDKIVVDVCATNGHTVEKPCEGGTCSVCGETVEGAHTIEYVAAVVPANCQETGHEEYWHCTACDAYFGDAEGSYQMNPAWITYTGEHVRPEDAIVCAVVPCVICGEDSYGEACDRGDAPVCQDATCVNCGETVYGWGCNYNTGDEEVPLPLCQPGDCVYCGTHYEKLYDCENGAWAPCLDGECSYGCGKTYPATAEHTLEDPCNGGVCQECWEEIAGTGHNYVNGTCSVCGATDPNYQLQEFVKSLSIAPRNNVALRFIIDPDLDDDGVLELEGDDNVAVFYKIDETSGEWTEADRVAQADWESYSNNRFTATYRIAARQMADEIKIVIVNANGDPISVEYTDSARAYGMRAVEKLYPQASSSEKTALQLTMFVDFLNYGAAAQTQFEYNTDDLANNQLTEDHQAYATAEAVAENLRTGHGSSQVSVKDSIELSFLLDQSVVSSDMYVVISYTHFDGTTESITVQGTDFDTYTSKGVTKWKVLTPNIKTPDGNQLITCVVYTADGTEVTRAQDSINSYMARVLAAASAAQSLKNLATAAVKFCASAYNYFTY